MLCARGAGRVYARVWAGVGDVHTAVGMVAGICSAALHCRQYVSTRVERNPCSAHPPAPTVQLGPLIPTPPCLAHSPSHGLARTCRAAPGRLAGQHRSSAAAAGLQSQAQLRRFAQVHAVAHGEGAGGWVGGRVGEEWVAGGQACQGRKARLYRASLPLAAQGPSAGLLLRQLAAFHDPSLLLGTGRLVPTSAGGARGQGGSGAAADQGGGGPVGAGCAGRDAAAQDLPGLEEPQVGRPALCASGSFFQLGWTAVAGQVKPWRCPVEVLESPPSGAEKWRRDRTACTLLVPTGSPACPPAHRHTWHAGGLTAPTCCSPRAPTPAPRTTWGRPPSLRPWATPSPTSTAFSTRRPRRRRRGAGGKLQGYEGERC